MDKRERKKEIKRLQKNRGLLQERMELLDEIVKEMQGNKKLPSVPLGGIFNDLLLLNPARAENLVPHLLENYKEEIKEVEALVASLN